MHQETWLSSHFSSNDVIGTKLTVEEIANLIDERDLDSVNDDLADCGLSKCIECGTWMEEVNDDWICLNCENDDG